MILRLYIDVSGKEGRDRVITAAGYIASDAEAAGFRHRWKATLDHARVPFFHATEFFACRGKHFKHFRRESEEHKRAAALFALTAYTSFQEGYGYSVDTAHYNSQLGRVFRAVRTPHDRLPAAMLAVSRIGSMAWKTFRRGGHQAEMLIEQGDGVGEIVAWLWHLKKIGEPWTAAFTNFAAIDGDEFVVQAADYLAHEAWLESARVLDHPERTWTDIERDTFKLITTGPDMLAPSSGTSKVTLDYSTKDHFESAAPEFAAFIRANPQYRRPPWYRRWRRATRLWIAARRRGVGKYLRSSEAFLVWLPGLSSEPTPEVVSSERSLERLATQ